METQIMPLRVITLMWRIDVDRAKDIPLLLIGNSML